MIIIDTSVWIDHLRGADATVTALLGEGRQRIHPFVVGELALGSLRDRSTILALLERMPQAEIASHDEVLHLIAERTLHGCGIGYVDAPSHRVGDIDARLPDLDPRSAPRRGERATRVVVPGDPVTPSPPVRSCRRPRHEARPAHWIAKSDLSKP